MIQNLLAWTGEVVRTYGAWGVFVVSVVEEIIAPIPSALTVMGAAFFLLAPYQTFSAVLLPALLLVALPAAIGMTLGGLIIYGLAYLGEEVIIHRWGKWLGISQVSVDQMKNYFERGHKDEVVLLVLRIVPIFPNSLISGVSGLLHYPLRSYIFISLIGGSIRAFGIALLGWWAEAAYVEYAGVVSDLEEYVLIGVAILALGAFGLFLVKKRK